MDYIVDTLTGLVNSMGFSSLDWRNYVMIVVALVFLYLAIKKEYEPLLLVPIAFGMLLVNIYPPIMQEGGLLDRKSTRLNSSHIPLPRMPSSA